MANKIDWGQGVNNNDIGWGQVSFSNSYIYSNSYSGQTEIEGDELQSVNYFISNISKDEGTFEGKKCLIDNLENI